MKLNTRTLAFAVALGSFAVANAQANVEFYLGYGNAAFAQLNGAAVGAKLNSNVLVPAPGGTFTVSLFARQTASSQGKYAGGAVFLGFGQAVGTAGNYANQAAAEAAAPAPISFASDFSNRASGVDGLTNADDAASVNYEKIGSTSFSREFGAGSTLRSVGLTEAFGFGTGLNVKIASGSAVRLLDLVITNKTLGGAGGASWGDASGENGLTINSIANATSRSTYFGTNPRTAGNPGASVKYTLTAVPEPGTMLAVAAGLAAFARRRRSK